MKHVSLRIESQIGKVLLQANEIREIPQTYFSSCDDLVQHFSGTNITGHRHELSKCFTVAYMGHKIFLR